MAAQQRPRPSSSAPPPEHHQSNETTYNIIPIHNLLVDHPSLRFPEVRAAIDAIRNIGNLPIPRRLPIPPNDLLDWLGSLFGFQVSNVSNQREHLVLHLANAQMRLQPPPDDVDTLGPVVMHFRDKLLKNYQDWCFFYGRPSHTDTQRHQLLYVALYLLIWGESANLRFMPECICYIYHQMVIALNKIIDENRVPVPLPGKNAFLDKTVKPIYDNVKSEVVKSRDGAAPHSNWRNYDDMNEYFWRTRCFETLNWPINTECDFFATPKSDPKNEQEIKTSVGKTGFIEQRSFLNFFRSFDKLWIMLILFLQASIIILWNDDALGGKDIQIRVLSVFITWSALRLLKSLLDAGMQYELVSRETLMVRLRMVLNVVISMIWVILLAVFYAKIWSHDRRQSAVDTFLRFALVFLIPEILALSFFLLPWVQNFLENTDGVIPSNLLWWSRTHCPRVLLPWVEKVLKNINPRMLYKVTWWFQTQSLSFVGGGLGEEGLVDKLKYSLFWIVVLSSKFCFSYFLQIKPMIRSTKDHLEGNISKFAIGVLWSPVLLIYMMDMQIWYSIYSSIVGMGVGLFMHLGEIKNMQQLRLRFQFFASAIEFNLTHEEEHVNQIRTFRDRLKMRYPFEKHESNEVDAQKFMMVWNEIILTFREEDIVSDREVELLELPPNTWNVRVVRWPCLLLCNELFLAVCQTQVSADATDNLLWSKMSKNEYRRCAVIEAYDSIKHLLLTIVKLNTPEHSIITALFKEIDDSVSAERFTETFTLLILPKIHSQLITLVALLMEPKTNVNEVVNTLQVLYEVSTKDFFKDKRCLARFRKIGLAPQGTHPSDWLLFQNSAVEVSDSESDIFYRQARRLHTILTSQDAMNNVPVNLEARRRLTFFSNSLFMHMPHAPRVEKMMAFSVLTPYNNEEVVYHKEQLRAKNEDGVSILYYLQTIYNDEWRNFLERMKREGMTSDDELWTVKVRELRLWASYRGQTLARTVRGMMYYHRALKMLAFLDSAAEADIHDGANELVAMRCGGRTSKVSALYKGHEDVVALMKYTYVVACPSYRSHNADEILYLMKNNDALRVAYVDKVVERGVTEYYSVLVKYDQELGKEIEIYWVKLPGPAKLGEGKPENQNHAMIFTRGDAVQAIDMNQDNYFEEALKMRNLLEEYGSYRKPTILGVRENIFTGSVSLLARFVSAQETSFVTLGQRVLANPLKIRLHYGHTDVFDRFWFLTRGGISKASRFINVTGDVFAGFNCTLRGGNVTHHEYIQVGKGRDVGLNQVSMFEAKVASGNGEQVLSRDVYRLGQRLDFFRMLSFYYTTVGFFFNTLLISLTVYAFLWGRLYLALTGVESSVAKNANTNRALCTILNQQFIVQLGLFTALPMIVENTLELGILAAIWDYITMQLQLSSVFFTFSLGTRAHYFGRAILHSRAKYWATGRGSVVEYKKFADNYRLYARSHFIKAIELGLILTIYARYSPVAKGTYTYIALTISGWFMVFSWIMAPFVFNPYGFDWLKTVCDYDDFMKWIWCLFFVLAKSDESWELWWYQELNHLRKNRLSGKIFKFILNLRFFFFQYGIVYKLDIAAGSKSIAVYLLSWIYIIFAIVIYTINAWARDKYAAKKHKYYRLVQSLVIILGALIIIALRHFTHFTFLDLFTSLLAFIPTCWGLLLIAQVLRPILEVSIIWYMVVSVARMYDIMFGMIIMTPVAFLSWVPGFRSMQTRFLFNDAFSRGLHIFKILAEKKSKFEKHV